MKISSNGNISALLALCAGNSPVTGEFPAQRPVMRSFDVFFDLHLNKRLSKQLKCWSFEMPSCSLWCHGNEKSRLCMTSLLWGKFVCECTRGQLCVKYCRVLSSSHCGNKWWDRFLYYFNTLRPRTNGCHFTYDSFKCIFLNKILIKIPLKFDLMGPTNNIPASVQIMAWHRPGYKPLSEPMMVSLLKQVCITQPQWVKGIGTKPIQGFK